MLTKVAPDASPEVRIDSAAYRPTLPFRSSLIENIVRDAGGVTHGFLRAQGVFMTVDVPGATFTRAVGINAQGAIVGDYRFGAAFGTHGFVLTKGVSSAIDFPGAICGGFTRAFGINDSGTIVGDYGFSGATHGFIYTNAGFR